MDVLEQQREQETPIERFMGGGAGRVLVDGEEKEAITVGLRPVQRHSAGTLQYCREAVVRLS